MEEKVWDRWFEIGSPLDGVTSIRYTVTTPKYDSCLWILGTETLPKAVFRNEHHDSSDKRLSEAFDSEIIPNSHEKEYQRLIDIIFSQNQTAEFLCRKLYRWFVNHSITDEVEKKIISPLAMVMIKNNYEVKPVLEALLSSSHFFQEGLRGAMIKNPLEFLFTILKSTSSRTNAHIITRYHMYLNLHNYSIGLGMNYVMPPSVSGWSAYYQTPEYYRLWINASLINARTDYATRLNL
jgi:uncharacterized protein (DUF1800 family)